MQTPGIDMLEETELRTRRPNGAPVAEAWETPGPLPALSEPVPALSEDLLPKALRPWMLDAAERICCPLEYVVIPTITAAGAVVGRAVGIQPKAQDDWTVIPNVWGAVIGRPGWMKSPGVREAMRPLYRLVAAARTRYAADLRDTVANRAALESQIGATKKALDKAAQKEGAKLDKLATDFATLSEQLAACVASERRYVTQDATVEKFGELLIVNPRGLLLLRDELAGWLRSLEKLGREGDREFYLEGWNGTGSFTVDRIGRGTLHIPALTISVCGGIQPGKLMPYVTATLAGAGGDDGMLQRFQLLVWPDAIGEWRNVDRWPNREARERANKVFDYLDALDPATLGATTDGEIPTLRFAPDAQELFNDWRKALENRLRSPALAATPALESHLAKYRSLMPSLALLFDLIERGGTNGIEAPPGGVPLEAARLAAAWCDFLEPHACKVLAGAIRADLAAAHALAAKIRAGAVPDGMTVRDLARREWAGLSREGAVLDALAVLERVHWVRRETLETGGRPSDVVRLHPDLRGRP